MDPVSLALTLAAKYAPDAIKYLTKSDTAEAVASSIIDAATFATQETKPEEIEESLANSPHMASVFAQHLELIDLKLADLAYADVKDARARDVAIIATGKRNIRADIMVLLDVVGLISCLLILTFWADQIPGEVVGLISTIAATFGLCLRDAHTFEFGSSRASKDKDDTISNLSK